MSELNENKSNRTILFITDSLIDILVSNNNTKIVTLNSDFIYLLSKLQNEIQNLNIIFCHKNTNDYKSIIDALIRSKINLENIQFSDKIKPCICIVSGIINADQFIENFKKLIN